MIAAINIIFKCWHITEKRSVTSSTICNTKYSYIMSQNRNLTEIAGAAGAEWIWGIKVLTHDFVRGIQRAIKLLIPTTTSRVFRPKQGILSNLWAQGVQGEYLI